MAKAMRDLRAHVDEPQLPGNRGAIELLSLMSLTIIIVQIKSIAGCSAVPVWLVFPILSVPCMHVCGKDSGANSGKDVTRLGS